MAQWPSPHLRRVARLEYGESLADAVRALGEVRVYGSNGQAGQHDRSNTGGPVIVIGRKGSFGKIQYSDRPVFAIDTTYFVDRSCTGAHLRWLYYGLQSLSLDRLSEDVGVPGLSREKAYAVRLRLPPLTSQRAIAAFLDRETCRVDALIVSKRRMIQLLQEKWLVRLERGIWDTGAPTVSARSLISRMEQGWSPQCENRPPDKGEWGVLKVGCVNGWRFHPNESKALPATEIPRTRYTVGNGDVLISRANTAELVGSVAVVRNVQAKTLLCDKLYRVTIRPEQLDAEYFAFALSTPRIRSKVVLDATGASDSMQNIGQDTIRSLRIPCPRLNDQKALSIRLSRLDEVNKSIQEKLTFQIELFLEHRQALIAAAVTGALEIPGKTT
jgi:type I restriction enzyme S subunit